jgi:glutamine amidotransferase
MTITVGVIDYAISNLASVLNAFRHIGITAERIDEPGRIAECTHLVLPGVGSFATGMANLHRTGMVEPLRDAAARGTPLLGLCLGMQLFADEGDEYGPAQGLGLIRGRIKRIDTSSTGLRLPHVGWNDVMVRGESTLLAGLPEPSTFYFVHSYCYADPDAPYVTGLTEYSGTCVAVVEQGNVFGAQFHPEKSQKQGMQLLRNFVAVAPAEATRC